MSDTVKLLFSFVAIFMLFYSITLDVNENIRKDYVGEDLHRMKFMLPDDSLDAKFYNYFELYNTWKNNSSYNFAANDLEDLSLLKDKTFDFLSFLENRRTTINRYLGRGFAERMKKSVSLFIVENERKLI